MSKFMLAPAAVALALTLAACGGNPPAENTAAPANTTTTAPANTTAPADNAAAPANTTTN